jgi:hypothetical protein
MVAPVQGDAVTLVWGVLMVEQIEDHESVYRHNNHSPLGTVMVVRELGLI